MNIWKCRLFTKYLNLNMLNYCLSCIDNMIFLLHNAFCKCFSQPLWKFCYIWFADLNECLVNICQHGGTCLNNLGSFKCQCPPGWTGQYCERGMKWQKLFATHVDCQLRQLAHQFKKIFRFSKSCNILLGQCDHFLDITLWKFGKKWASLDISCFVRRHLKWKKNI